MKERLKRPKSSVAMSLKREVPRMATGEGLANKQSKIVFLEMRLVTNGGDAFQRKGRTDAEHDDENDEGVEHGEDGGGDRRDHLAQLRYAAKEPDDAEGTHEPHEPGGDCVVGKVEDGHADDKDVQPVLRARKMSYFEICR